MIWYSWKRAGYRQYCVLPLECPQFSNCSEVQRVHGRGGVIRDVIVVRCVCAPHVLLPSSVPQHDLAPSSQTTRAFLRPLPTMTLRLLVAPAVGVVRYQGDCERRFDIFSGCNCWTWPECGQERVLTHL
jgi:hypothetical protein